MHTGAVEQLSERAQKAGRALAALGGAATPGLVGKSAGLDSSGQARALNDLKEAGLATGNKARVELTAAGWDIFLARRRPDAGLLDEALSMWPYRHRAFLELLLSAVVARHHLVDVRGPHLGGFMAIGATGTGKSSMGRVACHLLGLDPVDHTLLVPEQTEGSVRGRRELTAEGWSFSPAPATSLPLVIFDEFDKADESVRRAVFPYFHGEVDVSWEGRRFRYLPVPLIAANPARGDRYGHLKDEYRRRSVVLDTGETRAAVPGLDENLRAFYDDERWRGLLRLDALAPPAAELPAGFRNMMSTLRHVLLPEGVDLFCGPRALELAALGRAGLLGADSDSAWADAVVATAHDYVACMESIAGLVEPSWPQQFEALRDEISAEVDLASLTAALDRRRSDIKRNTAQAQSRRRAEQAEDLQLVRARAEFVDQMRSALESIDGRKVPEHHRAGAAGLRAQLSRLREDGTHVRSAARLSELQELARAPLSEALALRRLVDQEKAAELQRRQAEKDQARQLRAAARRHPANRPSAEQRRGWATSLTLARDTAKPLERLYSRRSTRKGEDVLAELAGYRLPDGQPLLVYERPAPAPPPPPNRSWGRRVLDNLAYQPPSGTWRSTLDPAVAYSGSNARCAALSEWGPPSREVLRPALVQLHAKEDELVRLLGRKARSGRPQVSPSSPRAQAGNVVPLRAPARALPAAATALPSGSWPNPYDPWSI